MASTSHQKGNSLWGELYDDDRLYQFSLFLKGYFYVEGYVPGEDNLYKYVALVIVNKALGATQCPSVIVAFIAQAICQAIKRTLIDFSSTGKGKIKKYVYRSVFTEKVISATKIYPERLEYINRSRSDILRGFDSKGQMTTLSYDINIKAVKLLSKNEITAVMNGYDLLIGPTNEWMGYVTNIQAKYQQEGKLSEPDILSSSSLKITSMAEVEENKLMSLVPKRTNPTDLAPLSLVPRSGGSSSLQDPVERGHVPENKGIISRFKSLLNKE